MKLFQGKLFSSFARKVLAAALVAAAVCFFALLPAKENGGGMSAVTAEASSSASISVEKYTVEMDIAQNRRISVREEITVRFLKSGLTMFYRRSAKATTPFRGTWPTIPTWAASST